jgi:hypothetical protein
VIGLHNIWAGVKIFSTCLCSFDQINPKILDVLVVLANFQVFGNSCLRKKTFRYNRSQFVYTSMITDNVL